MANIAFFYLFFVLLFLFCFVLFCFVFFVVFCCCCCFCFVFLFVCFFFVVVFFQPYLSQKFCAFLQRLHVVCLLNDLHNNNCKCCMSDRRSKQDDSRWLFGCDKGCTMWILGCDKGCAMWILGCDKGCATWHHVLMPQLMWCAHGFHDRIAY